MCVCVGGGRAVPCIPGGWGDAPCKAGVSGAYVFMADACRGVCLAFAGALGVPCRARQVRKGAYLVFRSSRSSYFECQSNAIGVRPTRVIAR